MAHRTGQAWRRTRKARTLADRATWATSSEEPHIEVKVHRGQPSGLDLE